jgi:peptidoglycan/LPS O-acetylase OafA/YrhL
MTASTAAADSSRIQTYDFMRGLAILGVIAIHAVALFPSSSATLKTLLNLGHFGVQLFFFVSAMTMCHMWQLRQHENARTRKFFIRRMMRIAPLFWLAIPLYLLVDGTAPSYWAPDGIDARQIVLTATFLHGFWPDSLNSVVPGGWSIAVEMTFYLVFPLLISRIGNTTHFLWLAVAAFFANELLIAPAMVSFFSAHYHAHSDTLIGNFLYYNFFNQLPIFFLGMAIYHKHTPGLKPALAWLALAAALTALHVIEPKSLFFLLAVLALHYAVTFIVRHGINSFVLNELGRYSYAIYLSHFLVIRWIAGWLAGLTRFSNLEAALGILATAALSYLVARALAITVEKGSHSLTRRWVGALG